MTERTNQQRYRNAALLVIHAMEETQRAVWELDGREFSASLDELVADLRYVVRALEMRAESRGETNHDR